ncbi:MAG: hypothetical protein DCC55_21605 [Chloroflexi bacterium]|nr:MAG: hypothetical protein DCC55_21605 [Chloroflexota bacterium]
MPMDELGQQTFDLTLRVASGEQSVGERAGHAQVQVWRNWPQRDASNLETLLHQPKPTGAPIAIQEDVTLPSVQLRLICTNGRHTSDQIGLILPTSLCASQVASMADENAAWLYCPPIGQTLSAPGAWLRKDAQRPLSPRCSPGRAGAGPAGLGEHPARRGHRKGDGEGGRLVSPGTGGGQPAGCRRGRAGSAAAGVAQCRTGGGAGGGTIGPVDQDGGQSRRGCRGA